MLSKIKPFLFSVILLVFAFGSLGMQNQQVDNTAQQILAELFKHMGVSAPVAEAEFRQVELEASSKPGKWQSATIKYKEAEKAWLGNYFLAETQTYIQGNENVVIACKTFVSAAIIASNDTSKVDDLLKPYREKNSQVTNIEFDGSTIWTSSVSLPDGGKFYQVAVWQNQNATFAVQFEVSYLGKSDQGGQIFLPQCPHATQQLDIKKWYETFHSISKQYASSTPAPALEPSPTPTPSAKKYAVTCDISWSEHAPMSFNLRVQDDQGEKLRGTPDDYLEVKVYWDRQRVPTNRFDGLLAIRPERPLGRTGFEDAQGFQTQSANPVVVQVMTDSQGVARLFVRTDFWAYSPGISPNYPVGWFLEVTRKYKALNAHGQMEIAEEPLGRCQLSVDSIAYVWGIKGFVTVENSSLARDSRYLAQGERLYVGDVLTARADTGGTNSYAVFTYLDGTKFGVKGNCPHESRECNAFRAGETTWGYILWKVTDVSADQIKDEGMEFVIKTLSPRLLPATQLVLLMGDIKDLASYSYSQEWSDTCAKLGTKPEEVESILNDYYRDKNIDTRPRLTCAKMDIKSLVNIKLQGEQINIRTFEGQPLIVADSGEFPLKNGQQLNMRFGGEGIETAEFIADVTMLDWDKRFFEQPFGEELPSSHIVSGDNAPSLSTYWFYLSAIPALLCLAVAFPLLILGYYRKNKWMRNFGLGLIGINACLALAAIIVFAFPRIASISRGAEQSAIPQKEGTRTQPESAPIIPTTAALPPSNPVQSAEGKTSLSQTGPWIVFAAENGLWAMNEDGSALTQVTTDKVIGPSDLRTGVSPQGAALAFITSSPASIPQDLTLHIVSLPDGKIKTITPLTSPEMQPDPNAELCDPKAEAGRAILIGNSLQWSPDGSQLAFVGALQGDSSDVYVYSLADESIARLSNEPGQAYDLHWHWLPESKTIAYFSATCFGSGAGFNMEGAYTVNAATAQTEKIYTPNPEGWGEKFITWSRSGAETFFVSTFSGCPQRDLRLVDIASRQTRLIFEGCFNDVVAGPTSALAVLASEDFTEQPGLYIYQEADIIGIPPVYVPVQNGRKAHFTDAQFFVMTFEPTGTGIYSFDLNGRPGWYQGKWSFPWIAPDEQAWAWNEKDTFLLRKKGEAAPVLLSPATVEYALWNEAITASGEIQQRLYFFGGQAADELYLAAAPDYLPILLAKGLRPLAQPITIR